MAQKKSWGDMTPTQKKTVTVAGIVEVAVTAWCAQGPEAAPRRAGARTQLLWAPALSVQPVVPIAYLVRGRKR